MVALLAVVLAKHPPGFRQYLTVRCIGKRSRSACFSTYTTSRRLFPLCSTPINDHTIIYIIQIRFEAAHGSDTNFCPGGISKVISLRTTFVSLALGHYHHLRQTPYILAPLRCHTAPDHAKNSNAPNMVLYKTVNAIGSSGHGYCSTLK